MLSQEKRNELQKEYGKLTNKLAIITKQKVEIEDELFSVMHELEEDFKETHKKELQKQSDEKSKK